MHFCKLIFIISFLILNSYIVPQKKFTDPKPIPIILNNDTLFSINAPIGPFTIKQRAAQITNIIDKLFKEETVIDSITIINNSIFINIVYKDITILSLSPLDTIGTNKSQNEIAVKYLSKIKKALRVAQKEYSLRSLLINSGISFGLFVLVVLLFWLIKKMFPKIYIYLNNKKLGSSSINFRGKEVIGTDDIYVFIILLIKLLRLALSLVILYYFITVVLSLFPHTKNINIKSYLRGILYTMFATAVYLTSIKFIKAFFQIINIRINEWKESILKTINIKNIQLFSEERLIEITEFSTKMTKYVFLILLTYLYFAFVFSFFKFSQTWADVLLTYFMIPINKVFSSFFGYIPNLATIIVVIVFTNYAVKFLKFIFDDITAKKIVFEKFPAEWGEPTYKIVRFLVFAFAAIVIFPYLPGSQSPVFQGISVLLGILFSLGSSSAISNIVAGVVLTYMRPFKIGDRVKIAETIGDVIEKTLLVTRVRTIKNVDITVPNSMILGSHIINFSSSVHNNGLILHTTVTIGYDVPWTKVHELLIAAAVSTTNIITDPKPFVLQTGLDDFYVSYEINAYTLLPNIMALTYSELHSNIQNKFNEAGVEIMSPHYSAVRDGNQTTIPEDYLPKSYTAPSFRITDLWGGKK
ncbi:MAG: mechanosensitive ion channel family protein [bacterium]